MVSTWERVESHSADRTVCTVRHLRLADKILVLDHGNIIESGTHDELMARSERYHDMVVLQTHPQN